MHGKAYPISLYSAPAVLVVSGDTVIFILRTSPRTKRKECGTYLSAEIPGQPVRGLNADLLPEGMFRPEFHIQCRYATVPIEDKLPHYRGIPVRFNGSDVLMQWELAWRVNMLGDATSGHSQWQFHPHHGEPARKRR